MASAPAVVSTERAAVADTPLGVTSWLDHPEAIAEQYESEDALTQRVLAHRELVVGPDDEEIVRERIREARPPRKDTGSISPRRSQSPDRRGLPVPFTLSNIKKDLDDIGSAFNGSPELEFRAATKALRLEKAALSYQYVPPGYRFPYGHTHETQEEVYVVVGGSGRMKLDDEVVELEAWDAVRVPPGTWRGYEAGPEGSRSSSSARPTLARIREAMSTASVTGGPTRRPRVPFGLRSAVRARAPESRARPSSACSPGLAAFRRA